MSEIFDGLNAYENFQVECLGEVDGYVYDIDLAEAQKKIASKIDKCKKDLKLVQSMQESTLLVQPSIQETHHLLENNRRFLVYHIFAKIPNAEDALDKKKPHLTADF